MEENIVQYLLKQEIMVQIKRLINQINEKDLITKKQGSK